MMSSMKRVSFQLDLVENNRNGSTLSASQQQQVEGEEDRHHAAAQHQTPPYFDDNSTEEPPVAPLLQARQRHHQMFSTLETVPENCCSDFSDEGGDGSSGGSDTSLTRSSTYTSSFSSAHYTSDDEADDNVLGCVPDECRTDDPTFRPEGGGATTAGAAQVTDDEAALSPLSSSDTDKDNRVNGHHRQQRATTSSNNNEEQNSSACGLDLPYATPADDDGDCASRDRNQDDAASASTASTSSSSFQEGSPGAEQQQQQQSDVNPVLLAASHLRPPLSSRRRKVSSPNANVLLRKQRYTNLPPSSRLRDGAYDLSSLQATLRQVQEEKGERHPDAAKLWNHVGNAHFRAKEYEHALLAYKESVNCEMGSHLGDSYSNIGTVYWAMGQVDLAIDFLRRARKVHQFYCLAEDKDPARSLDIATVRYQIGLAYTLQGNYRKALKHLMACRETRMLALGHGHLDVARVADALGRVYVLQRDYEHALRWYEHALRIKHAFAVELDDPSITLSTMQNVASVHRLRGDTEAALFMYRTVLQCQEDLLLKKTEKDDWKTLRKAVSGTLAIIGDLQSERGSFQEAKSAFNKALSFSVGAGFSTQDIALMQSKIAEL